METPIEIAVGIIVHRNKVLLVRRSQKEQFLDWQFPAGKLEINEKPFNTAEREVYEETGVKCKAIKQIGERKNLMTNVYIHYIVCDYLNGKEYLKDRRENIAIKWVNIKKIKSYIPDNLFTGIEKYLEI
jgi:8-oxo-dGTP diphosphatase